MEQESSSIEYIISALSGLENDIDNLTSRVGDMKKRLIAYSNEEIEKLKQQIITIADKEAKKIIDDTKREAEEESSVIVKEADEILAKIKKNIDSSYGKAVERVVTLILSENPTILDAKS